MRPQQHDTMEYILKGNPEDVAKVIRENRIRVQRGVISFIPVEPGSDSKEVVEDSKEVVMTDTKQVTAKKTRSKKSE